VCYESILHDTSPCCSCNLSTLQRLKRFLDSNDSFIHHRSNEWWCSFVPWCPCVDLDENCLFLAIHNEPVDLKTMYVLRMMAPTMMDDEADTATRGGHLICFLRALFLSVRKTRSLVISAHDLARPCLCRRISSCSMRLLTIIRRGNSQSIPISTSSPGFMTL